MTTGTIVTAVDALHAIRQADEAIEALQDARSDFTRLLVDAAEEIWKRGRKSWLGCTACHYTYEGWTNDPVVVHFGTDCTHCGRNAWRTPPPESLIDLNRMMQWLSQNEGTHA